MNAFMIFANFILRYKSSLKKKTQCELTSNQYLSFSPHEDNGFIAGRYSKNCTSQSHSKENVHPLKVFLCLLFSNLPAFHHYASISDLTLPKALQLELKGDIEDCLIDIGKWRFLVFSVKSSLFLGG